MSRPKLSTAFWALTIASIVVGLVASLMDSTILGLSAFEFFVGSVGLALLSFDFLISEYNKEIAGYIKEGEDPCPRCPPVCPWMCYLALVFFVIAVLAAFFGGEIFGVAAEEWFLGFVALSLLCSAGNLLCAFERTAKRRELT